MDASKRRLKKAAELAAQAVEGNVKLLLDLHRQLAEWNGASRKSGRVTDRSKTRARREERLRTFLLLMSSFREAVSRTIFRRPSKEPKGESVMGFDRSLVRALHNRIRRLGHILRQTPLRRKQPKNQASA